LVTLINLTFAPATTLPWGSFTEPRIAEVPPCANAVRAKTPINKAALKNRAALLKEILVFIESSDAFLSADPDLERAVSLDPKKMRGGLTVKKLADQSTFLQILFRDSVVKTPPQNTRVFTFGSRPLRFCAGKYIQISGGVYRNSDRTLFCSVRFARKVRFFYGNL
jgi:hypothetical protein